MTASPAVLVVDDDPALRAGLERALSRVNCRVTGTGDGATALAAEGPFDLLIIDRKLPDADGVELLAELRARGLEAPAIVITGHPSLQTAIDALGHGTVHYLAKPFGVQELLACVRSVGACPGLSGDAAADSTRAEHQPAPGDYLWRELRERHGFDHVMSASPAVRRAYAAAARVAGTRAPILLEGETGTGKDYLARAIHYMSGRADRPFVAVNCGALPEQLLASELFGHEKGAFTSATQTKKGLCEVADGGTLFLDEIGEMSLDNQVKLLRFTQDHTFTRLGGLQPIEVDVRIICATNRDLADAVADGSFREDLYYRLAVLPLRLPPLRERPEDIEPFARFFLEKHLRAHGRRDVTLTPEALPVLHRHAWPGNLRQLENVIQRALLLAPGDELRPEHLLIEPAPHADPVTGTGHLRDLATVEAEHIERVWRAVGGDRAHAAEVLGISERALERKLQKLGIDV